MLCSFMGLCMYGTVEFSEEVISKFGSYLPELEDDAEMLHTQMGYLADGIRNKLECTNEVLGFLEGLLHRNDAYLEIENAIAISFIEMSEPSYLGLEENIPLAVLNLLEEQQQRWKNAT